jgi:flagellin
MLSSLSSQTLNSTQALIQQYIQQISSGSSINSAADNPAGLAIADAMTTQLGGQNQAISNITSGLSVTGTADSALSQVTDNLQQLRNLTIQAGDGALNSTDLQALQTQVSSITQNIDAISGNTQFNGQALLNGSYSGQLQVGPNTGDTLNLNLGNVSSSALGISGINVTTASGANNALTAIDNALNNVSTLQSNVGATSAGLNTNLSNLNSSYVQLAQSQSNLQDTNILQAVSGLSQANVLGQAQIYALKQYQQNQQMFASSLLSA